MSISPPCPELEKKVKWLEKQVAGFKTNGHALEECQDQFQALLNVTTDSALLLNTKGRILAINEAGAGRLGKRAAEIIGENIYGLLPSDIAESRETMVAKVLRSGKPLSFEDKREGLFFDHAVYPVMDDDGKVVKLAIYAKDVTRQKLAEAAVRQREKTLNTQKKYLEEVNTALKVLMKRIQQDQAEVEEKVLANVEIMIMPHIQTLKKGPLGATQASSLQALESNLQAITSNFAHKLSSKYYGLTPKEIQVAELVKKGKTAKEISQLLCVSLRTIESHKKSIRKKNHIKNRKINLRTYLLSI